MQALGAAGEAVQALGVDRDLGHGGAGLALGPAAGGLGEEAAEVLVALAVGRQEGEAGQGRAWGSGRRYQTERTSGGIVFSF